MQTSRIGICVWMLWLFAAQCLAGETATAVATVTAGFVTGITVTSGGAGYTSEPAVTITGGGGSGATAKAILSGDKVATVVVLTAGSGYTSNPQVMVEAPPKTLDLSLRLIPEIKVDGLPGTIARIDWAAAMAGPWMSWSNVVIGAEGTVLLDLRPDSGQRFYRAVSEKQPAGTAGFLWIAPGTFTMGSPTTEPERFGDENLHTVALTQGFWMSDHEVTQAEFDAIMGSTPSGFKGDSARPVETVTWNQAVYYCLKLTERERAAGRITDQQAYRLPTESEWEYAARAGTTGPRYGELDAIAWWAGNSDGQTHPVKQKAPNAWGLHDMIGNVAEWCSDWRGPYPIGSTTNPEGPRTGTQRVARGGSWMNEGSNLRSAFRSGDVADKGFKHVGFRVVRAPVR